jgi:glycosyl transferase family 25
MKILIINLKKDQLKRKRANLILSSLGLDFNFIEAVFGNDLELGIYNSILIDSLSFTNARGTPLSRAEVGVYFSHIKAMHYFLDSNLSNICIFEDDFILSPNFKSVFINISSNIEKLNFGILMLGHFLSRKDKGVIGSWKKICKFNHNAVVEPLEFNYGCHGYIITREAAGKIVERFSNPRCPYDHITGLSEIFGLRRLIVDPPVVFQSMEFVSSVQNEGFANENIVLFYIKRVIKKFVYNNFKSVAQKTINQYRHL